MCCLLVLQSGDEASILLHKVFHLALILLLEAHQHYTQVLEYFYFVFDLNGRESPSLQKLR